MTALRRKTKNLGCPMRPLDLPARCDICGKGRARYQHASEG